MLVELKPEQERLLECIAQSGMNPEEVLDQAFAIIQEQHQNLDWLLEERGAVAAQIEEGFEESERGELINAEEAIRILHERRKQRQIA